MNPCKVAIIAVHGVADQAPGETAQAVAELLVTSAPDGTTYGRGEREQFLLKVPPLQPSEPPNAKPRDGFLDHLVRAFRQSYRSDLQRTNWKVEAGLDTQAERVAAAEDAVGAATRVTDYLLFKAVRNAAPTEAYESTRLGLRRDEGAGTRTVDVYEMYWADLSRLSGPVPRIVAELFTFIFRLSRLGRDTVDEARRQMREKGRLPRAWSCLAWTQSLLDWLFMYGLAMLFVQLLMLALVFVPLGQLPPEPRTLALVLGIAGPLLVALVHAYFSPDPWSRALVFVGAVGVAFHLTTWLLHGTDASALFVGAVWIALLTWPYYVLLRIAEDRFPFSRTLGMVLWAVVVGFMVHVYAEPCPDPASCPLIGLPRWINGALSAVDHALFLIKHLWAGMALLLVAWFVLSVVARRGGYVSRASVTTGQIGLVASLAVFLTLSMALWALLSTALAFGMDAVGYPTRLANTPGAHWAQCGPGDRIVACTGRAFLDDRYVNSTEAFAAIALLLLGLLVYLFVVTLPSVLAELKVISKGRRRLGRWLSAGYRHFGAVVWTVVGAGVAAAVVVTALLLFGLRPELPRMWDGLAEGVDAVSAASKDWLKYLVFSAATLAAALSAFGGVLSKYVPGLRGPLDIALDVDNWFREFPRKAIPRARICARYAALLEHVAAQADYERIVIVAHSQGTVITAELLMYLQGGKRCRRVEDLRAKLHGRVHLLTAGCPLRQLYASRFPALYRWVLESHDGRCGPRAGTIGVQRWLNAFTSGDYVGRWLWSVQHPAGADNTDPFVESVEPPVFGRNNAYDAGSALSATTALDDFTGRNAEAETCLGAGAHTHYFETGQTTMAWMVDRLVAAKP